MASLLHRHVAILAIGFCLLVPHFCFGQQRSPQLSSPAIHGEFPIGKEGRLIMIPVQLDGKKRSFLVDTGARRTGIDLRFRQLMGKFRGEQMLQTPAGRKLVETFDWPAALVNDQPLKTDRPVVCMDFTDLRQGAHEEIDGVIGMDVLRDAQWQVDFDRGRLTFLDTLPEPAGDLGMRLPLEFSDDGMPYLVGELPDQSDVEFLIDTGAQGNSLETSLFDRLKVQNLVRAGTTYVSVTVAGETQGMRGQLQSLKIGEVVHERLRVARMNLSSLGLRFFSRYLVTFDFPGRAIFLKKGEQFSKPEPQATSGMNLVWINDQIIVRSVRENGPAAKSGIQANDTLLMIARKPAAEFDYFALRQLLTSRGGLKVVIQVSRNGRLSNHELTLDED